MQLAATARRQLDARTRELHALGEGALARPHAGWIRAIRDALGMSTRDLAARLGVSSIAVSKMEASERAGTIGLDTLTRAADAMGCDVAYVLIPRTPLEDSVRRQAEAVAREELAPVDVTMALEDQAIDKASTESLVEERVAQLLNARGLWRQRS